MKSLSVLLCLTSIAVASGAAEPGPDDPAHAKTEQAPPSAQVSASLLGAYGAGGRLEDSAINRYGLGIGVRGGVTLSTPLLYLGGSFLHFLGGEDGSGEFYTSTLDAEVGYDLRVLQGLLVIRPQLALGVAQVVTIQPDNAGYPLAFHCAPGLLLGLRVSPLFASVEIRRDLVPGDGSSATSLVLGAGAVF